MPYNYIIECEQAYFPSIGRDDDPLPVIPGMSTERFDEEHESFAEAKDKSKSYESQGWTCHIYKHSYCAYVNIYLVQQQYGGPEEGDWWYEQGIPYASIPVMPKETAKEVADRYQPLVDQLNEGRPSLSSVLSEGRYRISRERHIAIIFPKERPHYE